MSAPNTTQDPRSFKIAGVDGCRAGWVVALVSGTTNGGGQLRYPLDVESIWVWPHFADVLLRTNHCRLVCVDIPIGLPYGPNPRSCDVAARKLLGRRAGSIFAPPVRACLSAKSYEDASEIHRRDTGKKLSKQSFFIMDKIRQVDELITPAMQKRVREIHPEVAFYVLNENRPAEHSKKRLAGRGERIALLSALFPTAERVIEKARNVQEVAPDDILDALAAAWTAAKAVAGQAVTLPGHPDRDTRGLDMEILCPCTQTQAPAPLPSRDRPACTGAIHVCRYRAFSRP